ncbi:transposase [Geminicoccus flavidas]|uniref:transposase n=1 Tax=Geminicoccus flavidas TaxID=2506407 RepID=UPI00135BA11F|nr:transposase [Geminicoccus flavidas]
MATLAETVRDAINQNVALAQVKAAPASNPPRLPARIGSPFRSSNCLKQPQLQPPAQVASAVSVAERSFAWFARFRRLARDYERLPETLAGLHMAAFLILLLRRAAELAGST